MSTDENKTLNEIKNLSLSILALADKNQLDEINQLDDQRQKLIETFFSKPISHADSSLVATFIEEFLVINKKITTALEKNKMQLSKEFSLFKSSQKATKAYLSNQ